MSEYESSNNHNSLIDFVILRQIVTSEKSSLSTRIFHAAIKNDMTPLCGLEDNFSLSELSYVDKDIWSFIHCDRCMFLRNKWISDTGARFKPYKATEYERRRLKQKKAKKANQGKKVYESSENSSNSVRTVRGGLPSLGKRK